MNTSFRTFVVMSVVALLILVSCTRKKNPTQPHDDNTAVPQGVARITGDVKDAAGHALSDVALHIVYDFSGTVRPHAEPLTPSSALFYDLDSTLYTECGGTTPLPDGVMVKIFWDQNNNGPDSTDRQPPLCSNPPDCADGPAYTVNFNEFPINGGEYPQDVGPGRFYNDYYFVTVGDMLTPNKFYGRIYCGDGNVLYESDVIDVHSGLGEYAMRFHCTPCIGDPGVPQWSLDQPYPNPAADSVYVHFNMKEAAQAVLTLNWPGGSRVDTAFNQNLGSGAVTQSFLFGNRPNGLYTVRFRAGSYQADAQILKNVTDDDVLRGTDAAAFSGSDGTFTLDTPAGVNIAQRGQHGEVMANAPLSHVKVVAIKVGYAVAETTFVVGSQQSYDVNLTLRLQ